MIKNDEFITFVEVPGQSIEDFIISEVDSKIKINKRPKSGFENKEEHQNNDSTQSRQSFLIIEPPENFDKKWLNIINSNRI